MQEDFYRVYVRELFFITQDSVWRKKKYYSEILNFGLGRLGLSEPASLMTQNPKIGHWDIPM